MSNATFSIMRWARSPFVAVCTLKYGDSNDISCKSSVLSSTNRTEYSLSLSYVDSSVLLCIAVSVVIVDVASVVTLFVAATACTACGDIDVGATLMSAEAITISFSV